MDHLLQEVNHRPSLQGIPNRFTSNANRFKQSGVAYDPNEIVAWKAMHNFQSTSAVSVAARTGTLASAIPGPVLSPGLDRDSERHSDTKGVQHG